MDVMLLREVVTVVSFLAFAGIVAYALLPGNGERFEKASRIPMDDDETTLTPTLSQGRGRNEATLTPALSQGRGRNEATLTPTLSQRRGRNHE